MCVCVLFFVVVVHDERTPRPTPANTPIVNADDQLVALITMPLPRWCDDCDKHRTPKKPFASEPSFRANNCKLANVDAYREPEDRRTISKTNNVPQLLARAWKSHHWHRLARSASRERTDRLIRECKNQMGSSCCGGGGIGDGGTAGWSVATPNDVTLKSCYTRACVCVCAHVYDCIRSYVPSVSTN